MDYQKTLAEATDLSTSQMAFLPPSQIELYRHVVFNDPWAFVTGIARFTRLVPRIHQPIAYAMSGCADHLAWYLQTTKDHSIVIDQFRDGLRRLKADWEQFDPATMTWSSAAARRAMRKAISFVVLCMSRGFYKSTTVIGCQAWRITNDPNRTVLISSATDPNAWAFCEQLGAIITAQPYQQFFGQPDTPPQFYRGPENKRSDVTRGSILLAGRTVPHKEPNVTALGAISTISSGHFDVFDIDDLTIEEQSDAERENATSFLSRMHPLKIRGNHIDQYFCETRHGHDDAVGILSVNPRSLILNVPNELHNRALTVATIRTPGHPTVPEIEDADAIAAEKEDYLQDPRPGRGATGYLHDKALIPDAESAALFPPEIVDRREWEWVREQGRLYIRRQARGERDETGWRRYVFDDGRDRIEVTLAEFDDATRCGLIPVWVLVDPFGMHRVLAIDPAVSITGDDWATTIMAIDSQQFKYQIETMKGKGHSLLLDATLMLDKKWSPSKIGVEKAGQQQMFISLMQADERYRFIAHKIVGIPNRNVVKFVNIRNLVSGPLLQGDLLLSPDDPTGVRHEAKRYKFAPTAIDNQLDSIAIGMTMLDARFSSMPQDEINSFLDEAESEWDAMVSPASGIPMTHWQEHMW